MIIIMKENSYLLVTVVVLIIIVAGSLHFPSPLHLHSQPLSIQCAFYAIPLYCFKAKNPFQRFLFNPD